MSNLDQVFFATGLGALSETYDFLQQLFDSDWALSSPIDFMGSVHNAPAGHLAQYLRAKGANLTFSGQDYSFEQALLGSPYLGKLIRPPSPAPWRRRRPSPPYAITKSSCSDRSGDERRRRSFDTNDDSKENRPLLAAAFFIRAPAITPARQTY